LPFWILASMKRFREYDQFRYFAALVTVE